MYSHTSKNHPFGHNGIEESFTFILSQFSAYVLLQFFLRFFGVRDFFFGYMFLLFYTSNLIFSSRIRSTLQSASLLNFESLSHLRLNSCLRRLPLVYGHGSSHDTRAARPSFSGQRKGWLRVGIIFKVTPTPWLRHCNILAQAPHIGGAKVVRQLASLSPRSRVPDRQFYNTDSFSA